MTIICDIKIDLIICEPIDIHVYIFYLVVDVFSDFTKYMKVGKYLSRGFWGVNFLFEVKK